MGPTDDDEHFYAAMERVVDWSDRILKANPDNFDAMLFKGAALGFRGRLKSNREEWLAAALDGRETLDYIFRIADADTANADFQFGRGVYDYFASVIPDRYPQVKPLMFFFPEANRERGLRNLAFTAEEGHFIRTEAVYFLLQIHLYYEPRFTEARNRISWLREHYPNNAYFHVLEGRVYARWSQWQRAIPVFEDVVDRHAAGQAGYADVLATQALFYIGRFHMENGRLEEGMDAFQEIARLSGRFPSDTYFMVQALLRTGMIHDLRGERSDAVALYRRVLRMEDQGGSRDSARAYLRAPYTAE
jgi:tetratricopeptide (TPR) repeat protein